MFPFPFSFLSGAAPNVPVDRIANAEAMSFNGTDSYIDAGNDSTLNISGDLTISAWVKIDNYSSFQGVVSKIDSSTRNYEILIRPSTPTGGVSFYVSNTTFITSTTVIPLNTWTHIVVAVESGVTNGAKIYINGIQDATTGTLTINPNTANLNIGRRATGSFYINGNIDEVAIFNIALSANKIQQIYDATAVVGGVPQTANLFTGGLSSSLVYWNRMGDS